MSYWMQISSVTFGLGHWSWGGENRDNFVTCALQSCTVQNRAFEFACVCTHNPYRIPAAVAHNSTQALVSYTHTSASKHDLKHMHSTCPTHTYTHTHVHARTRMRARTHTHIHLYAEHFDHTDGYKSSTCTPLLRSMAWATCHRLLFSLLHTNTYVYTTYFIIVHNKHICTHTHTRTYTHTHSHTHMIFPGSVPWNDVCCSRWQRSGSGRCGSISLYLSLSLSLSPSLALALSCSLSLSLSLWSIYGCDLCCSQWQRSRSGRCGSFVSFRPLSLSLLPPPFFPLSMNICIVHNKMYLLL